jgi:hypothetical protein
MVRFWYPTAHTGSCIPAEYIAPKVRAYLSESLGIPAFDIRTNSCREAPVLAGHHPVIIASHGYTGMYTDYTFLFEDLASRGYVVASIAHAYESTAVELPDGKLVTSRFGTYLAEDTLRMDDSSLKLAAVIEADLGFVSAEVDIKRKKAARSAAGARGVRPLVGCGHGHDESPTAAGNQSRSVARPNRSLEKSNRRKPQARHARLRRKRAVVGSGM